MSITRTRGHSPAARARRSSHRLKLETLESRMLLSATFQPYTFDTGNGYGITHDDQGNIWVASDNGLFEFSPAGTQIGSIATPNSAPTDLVFNSHDGNLYFSDMINQKIVGIDLVAGRATGTYTFTEYAFADPADTPTSLTVANDGSVWFTTTGGPVGNDYLADIGRIDPSGTVTLDPVSGLVPRAIAADSTSASAWFDAYAFNNPNGDLNVPDASIVHASFSGASITFSTYKIDTPDSFVGGLTVANDGTLWFSVLNRTPDDPADGLNRIVRGILSGGTLGQTDYVIPDPTGTAAASDLALDTTGRLWFTDFGAKHLSYLDTSTGDFVQMPLPNSLGTPEHLLITSNADGPATVWVTGAGGSVNMVSLDLTSSTPAETTITISAPTVTYNVDAGVNVTVASAAGDPSGTVTLSVDGGAAQSLDLVADGTATLTLSQLSAGDHTLLATYAAQGNYAGSSAEATLTVNRADLYVTAMANSKTYGDTANDTGTISGVLNDDGITANFSSAGDAATAPVSGSPYAITATLSDPNGKLGNYTVHETDATLAVNPADLYVTAMANSKTYGDTTSDTGTISGVLNDDGITVSFSSTGDAATASVSGSPYAIMGTLSDPNGKLGNYTVHETDATLTVNRADLYVTATANSKTYGDTANDTGTISGVLNNDGITVSFSSAGDAAAAPVSGSPYAITATLSDPNGKLGNYTVHETDASLTVGLAFTTTAVTSSANPAVYGQEVAFTAAVIRAGGNGSVPTGRVQFYVDGSALGAPVSLDATGRATSLPTSFAGGTSYTIQAVYNPSPNFLGSEDSMTQILQPMAVELDPSNPALSDLFIGSPGATSSDSVHVNPIGSNNTGSTGVTIQSSLSGVITQTTYGLSFAAIYIVLQNGNSNVQFANTLTINAVISAGNGNDNIHLGNGYNIVSLGNGNDNVQVGNGYDIVMLGNGNDNIQTGTGTKLVIAGNGNDNVQLGAGSNDIVILGSGNDNVQLGAGNDQVVQVGNGNDNVQLGAGSSDEVTLGIGNDNVKIGNGSYNTVILPVDDSGHTRITFGSGSDNIIT